MSSPAPRSERRLSLGMGAVLTPQAAAELLPWRDRDARAWLHRAGIVREVDGHHVVIWADVVEALRAADERRKEPPPAPRPRKAKRLPRDVRLP